MWLNQARHGSLTEAALFNNLRGNTGKEFGWLVTMASPETPLVGAHSHILDIAGHVYADRPEKLETIYRWVDEQLGWVRANTAALVVLSDHGIETSVLKDDNPGEHSWRAMLSVTDNIDLPLPESIYEIRSWLESQRPEAATRPPETAHVDTDIEHLRDLGYIE
jgi:hypothetical protein